MRGFFVTLVITIVILTILSIRLKITDSIPHTRMRTLRKTAGLMTEALLIRCEGPEEDRDPDGYIVYLAPSYSLEQHKETVGSGADLDAAIEFLFDDVRPDQIYYIAKLDEGSLAAVRADLGVVYVECDWKAYKADVD